MFGRQKHAEMRKIPTFKFVAGCLVALLPLLLEAQTRQLLLTVKSLEGTTVFEENDCSFQRATTWGGLVQHELCGEPVWLKDQLGQDALACDSIAAGLYAGKIALVRRGACEFGRKAYFAEQGGAKAVIIVNHFNTASENNCTLLDMPPGAFGSAVSIPVFFASRNLGEMLNLALAKGGVELCLNWPHLDRATASAHYATPLSQAEPFKHVSVHYTNWTATAEQQVEISATFTAPDGTSETLVVPLATVNPGEDVPIVFPPYKPKSMAGKHEILFTNNKHHQVWDTLRRYFYYTEYTFATDNLVPVPLGIGCVDPELSFPYVQFASLYQTGPFGGKATYATFGLTNTDTVFVPGDPSANQLVINLYDADLDGDGQPNLNSPNNTFDDLATGLVGQTVYVMTGKEAVDSLINVPIYDYNEPSTIGVVLKKNHAYYLSIAYDGSLAATGRCLRFTKTSDEYYPENLYTTPVYSLNQMYGSGWWGGEAILRLRLEGYDPLTQNEAFERGIGVGSNVPEERIGLSVFPNPADDYLRVRVSLPQADGVEAIALVNAQGKVVRALGRQAFQGGLACIATGDLPAGLYLLWVRTGEGGEMIKIMIK